MLKKFPTKRLSALMIIALTYAFSVGIVDSCQSMNSIELTTDSELNQQIESDESHGDYEELQMITTGTSGDYILNQYAMLNWRKAGIAEYDILNENEISAETDKSATTTAVTSAATTTSKTTTSTTTTTAPKTTTTTITTTTTTPPTTTTVTSPPTEASTSADETTEKPQNDVSGEMFTVYDSNSGKKVTASSYDIVCLITNNEIGSSFHVETIKAQAVAAYTYVKFYNKVLGQTPSVGLKVNPSQKLKDCVSQVIGTAIYYNGSIINATYCASSAGYTASAKTVWGTNYPYLTSVVSEFDYLDPNYGKTKTYSSSEIAQIISTKTGISLSGDPSSWFTFLSADQGGVVDNAYVGKMLIGGQSTYQSGSKTVTITGRVLRESILSYGIRSTAFSISYDAGSDRFTFTTNGYGHGVGMPQNGAQRYALNGYTYDQILTHYYSGTQVY